MSNPADSIAQHYHERTKYNPETIATKGKSLDWSQQPSPYKEYKIGQVYDLKPYLAAQEETQQNEEIKQEEHFAEWQNLSLFLIDSYGLTARLQTVYGDPIYLRAAPSAGGLYPAEIYLVSKGTSWLPAGLYNYQVKDHTIIHFWDSNVWSQFEAACFDNPLLAEVELAIVTTAVFYRSAWRYEDRAYRRVFLDTGHLLANLDLAASINGFRAYLIGGFQDEALNKILYLDSQTEAAIAVVPLLNLQQQSTLDLSQCQQENALASEITCDYPEIPDGELLGYLHQATQIETKQLPNLEIKEQDQQTNADKYNFPFCSKIDINTHQYLDWEPKLQKLEDTLLKRRSTRSYSGAEIKWEELLALLNFTYQPQNYQQQGLNSCPDYFTLDLIQTFIAVSGVTGLDTGCYYYAPQVQELRQVRFKNFRRELHYLCLGQNLGRDAAAVVFHTANLSQAIAQYGDRVYRYLHLDAGHLGQRMNLAAIHLNLGVSGIAGFFDNQVNEVLGIPPEEAVLYLTTLGRPQP